jgi:uncharacterized protein YcaQ
LPRKKLYADGKAQWFKITTEHLKQRKVILDRICAEGPLQSKDFEKPKNHKSGWFNYSVTKQMLERLFMEGELMISERQGFQKVYDLTEKVLPADISLDFPSPAEMARHLIETFLKSQALATEKEIGYLRPPELKNLIKAELSKMLLAGEILEVQVDGLDKKYFALQGPFKNKIPNNLNQTVKILSPFDNLVIQRQRLKDIFDFSYQIECYVPQKKRKYGYFTLPVLYKNNFVGVLDLKAHRQEKSLEVVSAFIARSHHKNDEFLSELKTSLDSFAAFNQCDRVSRLGRLKIYRP